MFANGYVGTAVDSVRIRRQEKERDTERKKYEAAAKAKATEAEQAGLKQFSSTTTEALEHAFKNETVGLVTKADFVKKRTTLQERLEEEGRRRAQVEAEALAADRERKRRQQRASAAGRLSFAVAEEGEGLGEGEEAAPPLPPTLAAAPARSEPAADAPAEAPAAAGAAEVTGSPPPGPEPDNKRPKLGSGAPGRKVMKNPGVATDFLPDRERAAQEEQLRAQLKKEYQAMQDEVKSEPLMIVYSYWDGAGHRREIRVRKGDSIGQFLKAVKEQLVNDFRELRHVSVDNLIYIKEDIILPHHHTFYELITTKARGKSGPLFEFGVHEDIRVVNDATREKNESHAGKVVERHWYDRNKHIFPASRWEIFDPDKTYESYSIYG